MIDPGVSVPRTARIDFDPATTTAQRVQKALTEPGAIPQYLREQLPEHWRSVRRAALQFAAGGVIERDIQGSRMKLYLEDPGISTDLALDGIREPAATRCYQSALAELDDPLVVDLGANIGYYAMMPLAMHDSAHVIAIEPDPTNVDRLQENVRLNGYQGQVEIIDRAVGAEREEGTLHRAVNSNCHTLAEHGVGDYTDGISVGVEPLPDILDRLGYSMEDVDVLRMDVEGYELEVLRGIGEVPPGCLCNIEIHTSVLEADEFNEVARRLRPDSAIVHGAFYNGHRLPAVNIADIAEYVWAVAVIETGAEWGGA